MSWGPGTRCSGVESQQRRGRDSNPRGRSSPPTRFPVALLKPLGHLSPRRRRLEPEAAHARLVPAEVVGHLVANRPLDLLAEYLRIPAEVPHERVLVDHDPVLVAAARHRVAVVVAVGPELMAAL